MLEQIESILNNSLEDSEYPGDGTLCEVIYKEDIPKIMEQIKALNKSSDISPIIDSDCVEACKTVVESYEGDGMENMNNRDQVMYDACKKALANHSL